jgi:hypothetical protein
MAQLDTFDKVDKTDKADKLEMFGNEYEWMCDWAGSYVPFIAAMYPSLSDPFHKCDDVVNVARASAKQIRSQPSGRLVVVVFSTEGGGDPQGSRIKKRTTSLSKWGNSRRHPGCWEEKKFGAQL